MPHHARLAAVDKPTYDGSQMPRLFDAEQLCAQGLAEKDLVRNPSWFATPSDYRKTLEHGGPIVHELEKARFIVHDMTLPR
jgi:hypothetical protein